jgi:hypothetical protein
VQRSTTSAGPWLQPTPGGSAASVGPAFLICGGASPPAGTRSRKTHVAHRRIKIERVSRPYLTALKVCFKTRNSRYIGSMLLYHCTTTSTCSPVGRAYLSLTLTATLDIYEYSRMEAVVFSALPYISVEFWKQFNALK